MTTITFAKIPTQMSDLMDHNQSMDMNLRILNTLSGSSLMCIILEESTDSFLVGLPCKLVGYGQKEVVEPYMDLPYIRIPFSALLAIIPAFREFEVQYIDWLIQYGNSLLPEVVTENYLKRLHKRQAELQGQAEAKQIEGSTAKSMEAPKPQELDITTFTVPSSTKYKH